MPHPFPGINPYIESRGLWGDFHGSLISGCRDALNDFLPENYAARIEEQVRLVIPEEPPAARKIIPDVAVTRVDGSVTLARPALWIATLEPATMTIAYELPYEMRETWVEIIQFPEESVVTVIEILSPSNKEGGGRGEYQDKRRKILESPAHLVEIDLLVSGIRPPMSHEQPWPPGEYYAMVSRAEQRPECQVYGWSIRRPIPPIPIPLAAPDADVWLDLAPLASHAYDRGRYAQRMRYDRPLDLPLSSEDLAWAKEIITPEPSR